MDTFALIINFLYTQVTKIPIDTATASPPGLPDVAFCKPLFPKTPTIRSGFNPGFSRSFRLRQSDRGYRLF